MSRSERRKERYRTDPDYKADCQARALARKAQLRAVKLEQDRLRGWRLIADVPENEVVKLYDPDIFWPVLAEWDTKSQEWQGVHYEGRIRPTHWMPVDRIPL